MILWRELVDIKKMDKKIITLLKWLKTERDKSASEAIILGANEDYDKASKKFTESGVYNSCIKRLIYLGLLKN